jgi:CBS domain-containing protein
MRNMKVEELMTERPVVIGPDDSLQQAAEKMRETECGILPVGAHDKIEGVITDRDIVVRAVAKGKDVAKEKVRDYMTAKVCGCKANDTVQVAADAMHKHKVSRLVVQDDDGGGMVGIITFGSILRKDRNPAEVNDVVARATSR